MNNQRTFLAIKPDGVQRGLIGEIISRLEKKGFKLVAMKFMLVSNELAEKHYSEHKGKPFFQGLVGFITSGPIVAMVWEGKDVITTIRGIIGKTNPADAECGTIRGDLAIDIGCNVVHGSDSEISAKKEISLFFAEREIINWSQEIQKWVCE